jgi:predicted nuclease of predicted toxin-antitoxin system
LCGWILRTFGVEAVAVRDLGMARADDVAVFMAAREAGSVLVTKDADF